MVGGANGTKPEGAAMHATTTTPTGLVVRTPGGDFPLVVSPACIPRITGDTRSDRAIRADCESGLIPTLPRTAGPGSHHRIPVAKFLDQLGVPYTIIPVGS
jgi:hypothetical protein